jgi:hypothetical protein
MEEIMKKFVLIGLVILISTIWAVTPVLATDKHINVKALKADVTYNVSGEEMQIPLGNSLNFDEKFKLQTNNSGQALVNYYKEAKIILKEKTIAKLYMNSIFIKKGSSWMKFVKRHSSFKIKTPSAVLGIRGTEFSVKVDEMGNTTVKLVEGEISVKTDKDEKILTAGNSLTVNVNNRHIKIMRDEIKKVKKDDNFKSLNLQKDDTEDNSKLNDKFNEVKGNEVKVKKIKGLEGLY